MICINKLFTGMEQDEMAQVFEEWNKAELESFLIEITSDILKYKDVDGLYMFFNKPAILFNPPITR